MDRKEMQNTRLYMLGVLLVIALLCYVGVLYDTQVTHYDDYQARSIRSIVRTEKVDASRGIITDRNGKVLVSNRSSHDLTFDASLVPGEEDVNEAILRLVELCEEEGISWTDNLPVTRQAPYTYTVDGMDSVQKSRFLTYLRSVDLFKETLGAYLLRNPALAAAPAEEAKEEGEEGEEPTPKERRAAMADGLTAENLTGDLLLSAGITPSQLLSKMRGELKLSSELTQEEARMVLGVQYELTLRKLNDSLEAYVLVEDIDTELISKLADGRYSGAKVTNSSVREYQTTYAAHILGYLTKISDYTPELKEQGYDMDDWIGRDGVEKAFEEYLKGTDGYRVVSTNTDGKVTGEYYSVEPEPGDIVELTIDLEFQKKVEDILAATVEGMNASKPDDSRGGGAAVVKVGTGEVLALASYPTYDLSTFRQAETWASLVEDPRKPMYNRAADNGYPPGSTLKPFTAIAALEGGYVTLKERIRDVGRWNYPGDEENSFFYCWYRSGHGNLNVTQAITNSCNYFFGEMGYRMGMEELQKWLVKFGLGEKTGIEIGETAGQLPENPPGQNQAPWAAFGQSTQLYSPLQLANYIATLVSGGKHCQAHLLKSAKAYDNSSVTAVGNTEPVNVVPISDANLQAVKEGMHGLVHGTLWPYFRNCVVDAGAKTGTAQVSSTVANNGVFVCFAPYDEPEIAVAIALERGVAGANLATTAVNILNAYYSADETEAAGVTGENQLLP